MDVGQLKPSLISVQRLPPTSPFDLKYGCFRALEKSFNALETVYSNLIPIIITYDLPVNYPWGNISNSQQIKFLRKKKIQNLSSCFQIDDCIKELKQNHGEYFKIFFP